MSSEDALSASELLEQEKEVPEELSRRLYINGGFLIIQGLPRNAEVGIDYKSFNIGEKFMGMKMVPNGLHYAFIRATPQSPMVSFFFYSGAHEIVYRKWNKQSETFDSPEIMDNTLMHHMQYNVKTYDRNLGHYAFDIYKTWHCLSSYISKDTILRLQPTNPGGYIDAQPEATTMEAEVDKNRPKGTQSYQVVDRNHPTRLRFADEEGLPNLIEKQGTKLRFTEVPNVTFEETMKKRSGVDGSDRLIQFIRRCGGEREFLGEFQVAYITFIVGHVHDSFVQWKKIIHLVCSCKAIMPQNPQLFSSFLATLHFHMKSHGDDYFHDELSKSSFLLYTLANLFANIADLEATPQSYELIVRSRRFKSILEKKFRVRFDIEEEPPTIA
ncbi:hypothetical protein QR680_017674 [Steinernema hermaphroditum]|uniref:Protein AAR2 homolog n=1 Tax=Steinernema hermaphroditum TaxID=289476 RepID=A0AA39HFF6_9BILA|nr:hypothetical protein QR680_017674 [Steinernema hermaphroditum]